MLLASLTATATAEGRTIEFSGHRWEVRGWFGSPGTGCWSDSDQSVWVDDEGRLHLKIRKVGGTWCQAEVRALEPSTTGDHTFHVIARLDQLDPDVVLGLFLYDHDAELDIEMTGSFGEETQRGWYTIFGPEADLVAQNAFQVELSGSYTSHNIRWYPHRIDFESWHGHCQAPPCAGWLHRWTYSGPSRPPDEMVLQPRINFWLHADGSLDEDQEIIISGFSTEAAQTAKPGVRRP